MEVRKGYKQTDIGVIPIDWEVKELSALSSVIDSLHQTPEFSSDGYAMVRVTDIKEGDLNLENTKRVKKKVYEFFTKNYKPKKNDIVMSRVGSYGVSSFVNTTEPFCMGQNTVVIEPNNSNKYLYYILNSSLIRFQIETQSFGTGYKSLSLKNIKDLKIQIPASITEQTAIATALSDTDALITSLEKLIAKKRNIKQGAMQELLKPKKGWEVKRLGDIAEIDSDSLDSTTSPKYVFKYISLEDVDYGTLKSHTEKTFETAPSRARRKVLKGDILISTVRPNLKSHLHFNESSKDWICSTGFSVLRCKDDFAVSGYVFNHLFHSSINRQIESLISGSNYPSINSKDVRSLVIPLPPSIEEQSSIASILSDMDNELNSLESKLEKYRQIKSGMMQNLLTGKIRLL